MNKLEKMNKITLEELEHIPDWASGSDQGVFRMIYQTSRMNALSESIEDLEKTRKKVILKTEEFFKKHYPDCEPEYDKEYFGIA
jgi:hypothetical protein